MSKKYNLDPGYITVPTANKIILRRVPIINQSNRAHYYKILAGAKRGFYGGKKHGKRMYQVRRKDILQYVKDCLKNEQLQLFETKDATVSEVLSSNQHEQLYDRENVSINYQT